MAVRENKAYLSNEIYFITFTILGWKNIYVNDRYCQLVYKWFDYMREKYNNKIHGYVILPNHIHCLIKVSDKSPKLPVLISNAKRFLAYEIIRLLQKDSSLEMLRFFESKAERKKGAIHKVFQPRYDSLIIQNEVLFLQKLNYIHYNPCQVKWGLSREPEYYKYSSAANYILGRGCYDVDVIPI